MSIKNTSAQPESAHLSDVCCCLVAEKAPYPDERRLNGAEKGIQRERERKQRAIMQHPTSDSTEKIPLPADQGITNGLKVMSYVRNDSGKYELTPDFLWQPVSVVNHQAWEEIAKKITAARNKVEAGRVSCLHYYMIANQMDPGLVAQYTGQPRWKVWLHLVPFIFNRVPADTLRKYAAMYKISLDDLRTGRLLAPFTMTNNQE